MRTIILRRVGLSALAILLAATGCADAKEPGPVTASDGTPERGGTAVLAEMGDMSSPNPLTAGGDLGGNLAADIFYRALLSGSWDDGRLVYRTADTSPMALARSYEYAGSDSSALRFHMHPGQRWSDGQPITAHDIVFTYEMVGEPDLASIRGDVVQRMDSVIAENDSTVVFYFDRRHPEMLFEASLGIIPRHIYGDVPAGELRSHPSITDPSGGRMVVSGPFMVGEWRKGSQIELVPNPHFSPRPLLDRIVLRVIPDPTTRVTELRTGGVDVARGLAYDQLRVLRNIPGIRLERQESRNYDYIAYNPARFGPFADLELRRALGLALDIPGLIRALDMEEWTTPAGGPYSPIFEDLYDPDLMPPLERDLDAARRILDAKGWRDSDGDGIRDRDGRPLRFTIVTNAGNQRRTDALQVIQQQWREVGVDAQIRTLELNTFFENLYGRQYEAALAGWVVGLSPDIAQIFRSGDQITNVTGYANPEVDSLFQLAQSQATPEAAAPLWKEAAARIVEDQPYTWLYYLDTVDGVNERLRGMEVDTYGFFQNVWEWWIPAEMQRGLRADTAEVASTDQGDG